MAYSFLNTTTYTNQLAAQQQLLSQLQEAASTPLGSGFDLNSYDNDLVEIVAGESVEPQGNVPMTDDLVEQPDIDDSFLNEPEIDDRVEMDLINSMFQEETPASRVRTRTVQPEEDEDEGTTTYQPNGRVKPRIWQYGGSTSKYQFGGNNTLYADTYEQQRIGLNDPNYNTAVFNTKGTNTFRGLDNHQPVAITDGRKYQVLYGPKDTAKFTGKVYERKMQFGGELRPETNEIKEFYNQYGNSPNYTKRLVEQGYANPQQVILDRIANIKPVTTSVDNLIGSQYNAPNYTVFYNPKDAAEYGFPKQSTLAHEYGHAFGASQGKYLANPNLELNENEMNAFSSRNKLRLANTAGMTEQQKLDLEHDSRPSESKADLDALRFRLFKDKIYDTGTQEFNPELLKKAKELYKDDNIVNRLFQNYSDEDLIYLMNHVAKNNSNINRPIYG